MKPKLLTALFLSLLVSQEPEATKLGVLPGVSQPHSIHVVGDDLVFLDGFTVEVFSLDPLVRKTSFAGEGDEPHQFKYWPQLFIRGDTVLGTDYLKTSWFSLDGDLLRILPYSEFEDFDPAMEMVLTSVGDGFLRITVDHESSRRTVRLFAPDLRPLGTLYEGLFDWRGALPSFRIDFDSDDETVLVSDSEKGFFLLVFDTDGTLLRTIDRSSEVEPIRFTESDRRAYMESVRVREDSRFFEQLSQTARFKEHYPMINHVQVDGGKLYVTTHRTRGENRELVVLNLEGRILETLFLPLKSVNPSRRILRFDPYVIHEGRLYEIVRDRSSGMYELWMTELD